MQTWIQIAVIGQTAATRITSKITGAPKHAALAVRWEPISNVLVGFSCEFRRLLIVVVSVVVVVVVVVVASFYVILAMCD